MGDKLVTIAVAIIGVATLAVLVGRQAKTSEVITSGGNAFAKMLGVAVSPVMGGSGMNGFVPQF